MTSVEHPLLLVDALAQAAHDGVKTQTRRPVVSANSFVDGRPNRTLFDELVFDERVYVDAGPSPAGNPGPYLHVPHRSGDSVHRVYPRVQVGDVLWVRETWALEDLGDDGERVVWAADREAAWRSKGSALSTPFYLASNYEPAKWRPSIHMPRWAARTLLEVVAVGAGRPSDITEADASAEGVSPVPASKLFAHMAYRVGFERVWTKLYGEESLTRWAWSYTFRRVEAPR